MQPAVQAHDLGSELASVLLDSDFQERDEDLIPQQDRNLTSRRLCLSLGEREDLRLKAGLELHRAVLAFDPADSGEVVQSLLQQAEFIDVNARDKYRRTPLHVAVMNCENSSTRVVKLLLATQEVDVNATALYGLTPLHLAARLASTRAVQLLLMDPRVRLDAVTDDEFTAFHLVAEGDDDQDQSTDGATTLNGYLQRTSKRGTIGQRCQVVRMLLEEQYRRGMRGCENERDILGRIPLYYAAIYGCVEMIEALLSSTCSPRNDDLVSDVLNAVDVYGFAPLHLLAHNSHPDAAALLLRMRPNIDVNVKTEKSCNWHEFIRPNFVSESGAPLCLCPVADVGSPQQTSYRMTALHIAAELGDTQMVQLLLSSITTSGTQINEKDSAGWTPLHFAADQGDIKTLRLLLHTTGIEINEKDSTGSTPMHLAAEQGHIQILGLLLNTIGIKVNETDTAGSTPLHLAACKGRKVAVQMFLEKSEVDFLAVNAEDDEGLTPLFQAVKNSHTQIVRLLLDKVRAVAQLTSQTSEETFKLFADLLQLATDQDIQKHVAWFLLERLEDVYKENGEWDGSTLMHTAAKKPHDQLIRHIFDVATR